MTRQLGRFELGEQIDAGGFTTVYRATEDLGQGIKRPAAVKVLQSFDPDDTDQVERLRREVEVLVALGGAPNIVSILATGIDEDMGAWIAMELEGKSLAHQIGARPAEPDQVRVLLRDTLRALVCVHGAEPQILHRDLKPQNILASQGVWKVSDFGVAKRRGAEETMSLATVKYAAPELLDATLGEESPRLDLYALGMVAYEYALGSELFREQFPSIYDPSGGSAELDRDDRPKWMYWHTSQQMTLPPVTELVEGYPEDLSDLIAAMTAKPAEQRIASAEEALRRLGTVDAAAPLYRHGDDEEEESARRVSPVIALTATIAVLVALVGALMWFMLGGRPTITLASDGRFQAASETIEVAGTVANLPEAGRGEIRLRRGSVRNFDVAFESDGRSTCRVRLPDEGTFPAMMVVEDRSGATVARASLELERSIPTHVQLEIYTKPVVRGATVRVYVEGGEGEPILLTTNSNGAATTPVPYGDVSIEAFHPRYDPMQRQTRHTGIDSTAQVGIGLKEKDFATLRAEMQREIDRLMRLMKKKTVCPPDPPLTPAEEQQVTASVDLLRELAEGDRDIELFLVAVGDVENCKPDTMVTAPELPPVPMGEMGGEGVDPAVRVNLLIARIERLLDRKVNCPPGPLSDFEERALEDALAELNTLALGDPDLQAYVDAAMVAEDCKPETRPDPENVPFKETQAERNERTRRAASAARETGPGSPEGTPSGDTAEELTAAVERALREQGFDPRPDGSSPRDDSGQESADSVMKRVLSQVPPNPELVARLLAMSLDEFTEFVSSNVPTGAIEVTALEELDQVRLAGPLFRTEELELVTLRLAYGMSRIQPELRIDPWGVCRGLSDALTAIEATGVRVTAYLVASDPTVFVQYEKSEAFERARAQELSETFVVDRGLLWVRGYIDRPAEEPDKTVAEEPDES